MFQVTWADVCVCEYVCVSVCVYVYVWGIRGDFCVDVFTQNYNATQQIIICLSLKFYDICYTLLNIYPSF